MFRNRREGKVLFGLCLAGSVALSSTSAAQTDSYPSELTPKAFTTHNYSLTFLIPPGLYRCSLPASYAGSDHGMFIYLEKPISCNRQTLTANSGSGAQLPNISIFYSYNVIPVSVPGLGQSIPTTNAELVADLCKNPSRSLKKGLYLFGLPAVGCVQKKASLIQVILGALYSQESTKNNASPDSQLTIEMSTTETRFNNDLELLKMIAGGAAVCSAEGIPPQTVKIPQCPPHIAW